MTGNIISTKCTDTYWHLRWKVHVSNIQEHYDIPPVFGLYKDDDTLDMNNIQCIKHQSKLSTESDCSLTIFTVPPLTWLSTYYLYCPTSYLTVHLLSLLSNLLSDCPLTIFTVPPLTWLSIYYLYCPTSNLTVHLLSLLSHLLPDCSLTIFTVLPLIWLSTYYLYRPTSYLTVHLLSLLSHL